MYRHDTTPTCRPPLAGIVMAAACCVLLLAGTARAEEAEEGSKYPATLSEAYHGAIDPIIGDNEILQFLLGGTPQITLRLGYEYSDYDDAGGLDPADSLTLQSRFNYRSGTIYDSSFFLQLQHNWNLVEDFRWPGGGDSSHDVVADPDGARIHQLYADLGFIPDVKIRVGQQEIILDDSRLIGNVGWRQGAQSFSAASITYTGIDNVSLYGAYVWDVYNIFLDNNPDIDHMILLRGEYNHSPKFNLSVFTYLLDTDADTDDSATYGLRVWGTVAPIAYDATIAYQGDYQDEDNDGFFGSAEVKTVGKPVNVGLGYQYISGGGGEDNFSTLFATGHKFNGWADQFLSTGGGGLNGGLQDAYALANANVKGFAIAAAYHYFHTADDDTGFDGEYGQEFDLVVTKPICKNLKAQAKYAHYESAGGAGNPTEDEDVIWLRLMFSY